MRSEYEEQQKEIQDVRADKDLFIDDDTPKIVEDNSFKTNKRKSKNRK